MSVRTWTATAIRDGGTFRWFVGLSVKLGAEIAAAAAFGWVTARFVLWQFPVDAVRGYVGAGTSDAVWLAISAALFWRFTLCKFTEQLVSD